MMVTTNIEQDVGKRQEQKQTIFIYTEQVMSDRPGWSPSDRLRPLSK